MIIVIDRDGAGCARGWSLNQCLVWPGGKVELICVTIVILNGIMLVIVMTRDTFQFGVLITKPILHLIDHLNESSNNEFVLILHTQILFPFLDAFQSP